MRTKTILFAVVLSLASCKTSSGAGRRGGRRAGRAVRTVGVASYYHDSLAGNRTASGEVYDPEAMTCAHRSLPFGTKVEIEVLATGRTARCRINDRGPFAKKETRIIDVSRAVAQELGFFGRRGIAKVAIRILD